METGHHVFLQIKFVLAIFVEGHPVIISEIILNSDPGF